MMISQPALICLNATWQRLMRRSTRDAEPVDAQILEMPATAKAIQGDVGAVAEPSLVAAAVGGGESLAPVAREQGQGVHAEVDLPTPLAANERRARAAALRAMVLSRERRFDAARAASRKRPGLTQYSISPAPPRSGSWSARPTKQRSTLICKWGASVMRQSCVRACRARFARSHCGRGPRSCSAPSDGSSSQFTPWWLRGRDRRCLMRLCSELPPMRHPA